MGVGKYAALCKCMYIFIIRNQVTASSIKKYAQIITWQTQSQQATTAVSVSVC